MSEKLKTVNIKGKNYVQVNERVKAFRSNKEWRNWSIQTDVRELTDDICVMCATILDTNGTVIATGWAREVRNDAASMVNKTSYVENCETSAVGRALGFLGIGVDENICSVDELVYALQAQEATKQPENNQRTTGKQPTAKVSTLPSEDENELALLADIDAADTIAACKASIALALGQPYEDNVRRHGTRHAILLAKNAEEMQDAWKMSQGWSSEQELLQLCDDICKQKKWGKYAVA